MTIRVTLDQWLVFQAIIDTGGFAQAARVMHRSQSSISYAVRKLQDSLGLELFEIHGRRAELTEAGRAMLERSRRLTEQANELESIAKQLSQGWEPNIRLAVENVLPTEIIMQTLKRFESVSRGTRIHLREEVLSGVSQALEDGAVDLAISPIVPAGYLYDNLMDVEFLAVAHCDHGLHQDNGHPYGVERLRHAVHIVIRDSGVRPRDAGWIQNEQKWTVSSFAAAIDLVANGLGFAWLPRQQIQGLLDRGVLKPLLMEQGGSYRVAVNLVYGNKQETGPATRQFIRLLKDVIRDRDFA
jgi:DNA-binding transcriptional LysR family regulator